MSHNPNTVKSQDELNEGGRKSDVLLSTIDKIVEVEEWNKDMQAKYGNLSAELEKTKSELNYLQRLIMELYHTDNLETAMIKLVQQTQPKLF